MRSEKAMTLACGKSEPWLATFSLFKFLFPFPFLAFLLPLILPRQCFFFFSSVLHPSSWQIEETVSLIRKDQGRGLGASLALTACRCLSSKRSMFEEYKRPRRKEELTCPLPLLKSVLRPRKLARVLLGTHS